MNLLPADIQMGAVTLRVADLDAMTKYYSQVLGLLVIAEGESSRVLGGTSGSALILEHSPALKHAGPSEAGLFHTAFLFPTRSTLASAVYRLVTQYPRMFTGSADHLVSEAFYFNDPEGNGVELYFDKDRTSWSWVHGEIQMDTLRLDPKAYLDTHLGQIHDFALPVIGHVHLSVGDIEQAREFYVNTLGFEVTMNWGNTALFVSAGGYHHHMAMNIWRSRGAGKRQQTLGLGDVSILLPDGDSYGLAVERATDSGAQVTNESEGQVSFSDPWGNQVSLGLRTI